MHEHYCQPSPCKLQACAFREALSPRLRQATFAEPQTQTTRLEAEPFVRARIDTEKLIVESARGKGQGAGMETSREDGYETWRINDIENIHREDSERPQRLENSDH